MFATEEKGGKFAEDPDIQIHKIVTKELGHDNSVDQSGLIVKKSVQDQWIPQAHRTDQQTASPPEAQKNDYKDNCKVKCEMGSVGCDLYSENEGENNQDEVVEYRYSVGRI